MTRIDTQIEDSSGNACADIGVLDAEAMTRKSRIAAAIQQEIIRQELSLKDAAARAGIPQTRLTAILRGQFRTIDELILAAYLRRLGGWSVRAEMRSDPEHREMVVFG
jgi:predicted XRE-type DNA-binding protein